MPPETQYPIDDSQEGASGFRVGDRAGIEVQTSQVEEDRVRESVHVVVAARAPLDALNLRRSGLTARVGDAVDDRVHDAPGSVRAQWFVGLTCRPIKSVMAGKGSRSTRGRTGNSRLLDALGTGLCSI